MKHLAVDEDVYQSLVDLHVKRFLKLQMHKNILSLYPFTYVCLAEPESHATKKALGKYAGLTCNSPHD